MKNTYLFFLANVLFSLAMSAFATTDVKIIEDAPVTFNPSRAESIRIPVKVTSAGKVSVAIYSTDGDLVRRLSSKQATSEGQLEFAWDGKDSSQQTVPDEAYIPVLTFKDKKDNKSIYDSRTFSGGEEFTIKDAELTHRAIQFTLSDASRVLVRAGVKSGPLLNGIVDWQVRGRGQNKVAWNGYDKDKLTNLLEREDLALVIAGFKLPRHAIIAVGNDALSYREWRAKHNFPSKPVNLSNKDFERSGQRISRHYYLPSNMNRSPRVTLALPSNVKRNEQGLAIIGQSVILKVDMHPDDQQAMQQSLYEVAFFLDQQFLSEEEQGYVPLSWRWNPSGVKPGVHTLTVNVSGFEGQVGIHSVQIVVPDES